MKLILFILGLLLVLGGFLSFASIAIANIYFEENLNVQYTLIIIGFILLFLGIVLLIFFVKKDKPKDSADNAANTP
jgi:cytochrome c biogenesis protein CcdA